MKHTQAIRLSGHIGLALILVYLIFHLKAVDLSNIYYWQQSIPVSIAEALKSPGGFSGMLGEHFLEWMTKPTAGFLGVALLVLIIFYALRLVFRQVKSSTLYYSLILAVLLPFILLFSHYRFPMGLAVSFTAALLLAGLQSLWSPSNLLIRSAYNLLAGLILYLVTGSAGLFVFIEVLVVQAILDEKYLNLTAVLPVLAVPFLYLPFNTTFTVDTAWMNSFIISKYDEIPKSYYLCLGSPLVLLLFFMGLNRLLERVSGKWQIVISAGVIIVIVVGLHLAARGSIIERERAGFKILQAAFNDDWEEVIQRTRENVMNNKLLQYEANRALYHTGRMLDDLFMYPQLFGEQGLFLEGPEANSRLAVHMSDFYYDLGFANESRHWAMEAHMSMMRHPFILKRLVLSYIAIGDREAALKYLRILSRSRLYRDWHDEILKKIEDNSIMDEPDIRSFLHNNPAQDFFAATSNPTGKLKVFYVQHPDNNMAFEYLMASYLLQHKLGNIMAMMPEFRKFGYGELPRNIQEAVLIYAVRTRSRQLLLGGYGISEEIANEFKDFSRLVGSVNSREEKMAKATKYRNTYWYYIMYTSPYAQTNTGTE
jgi:hypothetical protein